MTIIPLLIHARTSRHVFACALAYIAWIDISIAYPQESGPLKTQGVEVSFMDLAGVTHRPFNDPKIRAAVLVFVVTDCPVSNTYMPEMNRLHAEYSSQGVKLFVIHVDAEITVTDARHHAREYQVQAPVAIDRKHTWVKKLGVTVTPEAAVISSIGDLLYRGRIDNRYVDFGKRREQVSSRDLREALDSIIAGRPIPHPRTKAIGCPISALSDGE